MARSVVQRTLTDWQAGDIFDDVVLVASELVANALRHGLKLEAQQSSRSGPAGVRISLISTGRHLICAVTDPSAAPPVRRNVDMLSGSGRGLQLVESLSLDWGWTPLADFDDSGQPDCAGKSVWAIFPLVAEAQVREAGAA